MGSASKFASVDALLSSDDHLKELVALISQEAKSDATVKQKCFDLDDDMEISTGEPLPMRVFGGARTLQLAKAAASEMIDALVRINGKRPTEIKPNVTRTNMLMSAATSFANDPNILEAMLKNPAIIEYINTMSCHKKSTTPSLKMISSLSETVGGLDFIYDEPLKNSSDFFLFSLQSAATSYANDPNISEAMLKNPAIIEYIHTMRCHKKSSTPSLKMISSLSEIVGGLDFIYDEPLKNSSLFGKLRDGVKDLSQNVKTQVVGMVSSLSNRIWNRFGTSSAVPVDHPSVEFESSNGNEYGFAAVWALIVLLLWILKR